MEDMKNFSPDNSNNDKIPFESKNEKSLQKLYNFYVQQSTNEEVLRPTNQVKLKQKKQAAHSPEDLMLSIADESRTIQMPQLDRNRPTQKVKLMLDIDEPSENSQQILTNKHSILSPVIKGSSRGKLPITKSSSLSSLFTCC